MGSLGYVWHAQPESYDQLLWILKENHVKKRRLRKTTTKWSLKGAKKYHTGIYSLNRPLLQVDEAINQKVLLDFLLQIGGLLCCWEINFAILLSRSKKLTQMEMWHSHIWLLAESQHTLATSCHWIYKNLEPCGPKERIQQQSQTKKNLLFPQPYCSCLIFLIIYLFLQELILYGLRSICKIYTNQNPQNFVCLTVW